MEVAALVRYHIQFCVCVCVVIVQIVRFAVPYAGTVSIATTTFVDRTAVNVQASNAVPYSINSPSLRGNDPNGVRYVLRSNSGAARGGNERHWYRAEMRVAPTAPIAAGSAVMYQFSVIRAVVWPVYMHQQSAAEAVNCLGSEAVMRPGITSRKGKKKLFCLAK